jgi:type II secretory pathway component PulL
LGIATGKFKIPEWITRVSGFEISPEKEALLAEPISLALARLSKEGRKQVNFRKGEFAYKAQFQIAYRRLAFPVALLLVMLILGIAKAGTQYSLLNQQSKQINQQINQKYVSLFPGAKPSDPVSQLKQAFSLEKARLKAEKDLFYPTAVECLAAIGDQVPREVGYQLSKFSYNKDKLRLEGDTVDFARTKEIVDRLNKVEFFKKVDLEDSRSGPNGKVNFVISVELKNPAELKVE